MRKQGWVLLFIAIVAGACGKVTSQKADADMQTSDSGAHACVFGSDTFDVGCTFGL